MATLAFLQSAKTAANVNLSTFTFSSQNLGTADSDRYIIVAISAGNTGASTQISSCTIGGVSATVSISGHAYNQTLGFAIAKVPTGTTGDIVVVMAATMTDMDIHAYRATGLLSLTYFDTQSSVTTPNPSVNLGIPMNGIALAISHNRDGAADFSWSGLTENFDETDAHGNDEGGASLSGLGQQTLTVTVSPTTSSLPQMRAVSYSTSRLKTINGLAIGSVKVIDGINMSGLKSWNGI